MLVSDISVYLKILEKKNYLECDSMIKNVKFDTRNLHEKVYLFMRDRIIANKLKPGTRINYEEFIEELGVSKTPVRDAINRLQQDGLVEIRPRSGTFVKIPNAKDIEEMYDLRKALERQAIERAIKNMPSSLLEEFQAKTLQAENRLNDGDVELFFLTDRELHKSFIHYSDNSRLILIMESLQVQFNWLGAMLGRDDIAGTLLSNNDHKKILNAMLNSDLASAQRYMEQHIEWLKVAAINNASSQMEL